MNANLPILCSGHVTVTPHLFYLHLVSMLFKEEHVCGSLINSNSNRSQIPSMTVSHQWLLTLTKVTSNPYVDAEDSVSTWINQTTRVISTCVWFFWRLGIAILRYFVQRSHCWDLECPIIILLIVWQISQGYTKEYSLVIQQFD